MVMNEAFSDGGRQQRDALMSEAVRQVIERGLAVVEVAARCGISKHTLYGWVQRARLTGRSTAGAAGTVAGQSLEIRRLEAELGRVIEERDRLRRAGIRTANG